MLKGQIKGTGIDDIQEKGKKRLRVGGVYSKNIDEAEVF